MATYVVCFVVLCLSDGHTVVNGNLRSVFRGALSVGLGTRWLMATYVVCFVVLCLSGVSHGG